MDWFRWDEPEPNTRSIIRGRYKLVEPVGVGSFGTVWRAIDLEHPDRPVALKQSRPADTGWSLRRDRALREGTIARQLDDEPNVVAVHEVFDENGCVWLLEEYLDSLSLEQVLAERGRLDPSEVAWIGAQVATGLAAAHSYGIVHRDIAPANILISRGAEIAKIADFGVARQFTDPRRITVAGAIVGRPAYKSPDEAHGGEATTESDVFSLGAVLYHALEGHPPFGDDDETGQLLNRIRGNHIPRPRHAGPLEDTLVAMLQRIPHARPSAENVAETLGELDGALSEPSRSLLREHRPTVDLEHAPTPPGPRRPRRVAFVAIAVATVILVAAGIGVWDLVSPVPTAAPSAAASSSELPASVPTIIPTGDRRAIDLCGLIDLSRLRKFGPAVASPGRTLTGCTAYYGTLTSFSTFTTFDFDSADYSALYASQGKRAPSVDLGGVRIDNFNPTPYGSYTTCTSVLILSDSSSIEIQTQTPSSSVDDSCVRTDAAAIGALRSLATIGGLKYDQNRINRIALGKVDACRLINDQELTTIVSPTIARQRIPGIGNWSCTIGDYYQGSWYATVGFSLLTEKTPTGAGVQIGSRSATRYFDKASGCTTTLPVVRESAIAPTATEYVSVTVNGPSNESDLCSRSSALLGAIAGRLPIKP